VIKKINSAIKEINRLTALNLSIKSGGKIYQHEWAAFSVPPDI